LAPPGLRVLRLAGADVGLLQPPGQDQQRHPQPQQRKAEDEHEVDQVLDQRMGRRRLVEMPERVTDQALAEAKAQIDDAKRDHGRADPKAPPREFFCGPSEADTPAVLLGVDDHEQGQGRDDGTPELADISELIERHSVEPAHHVRGDGLVSGGERGDRSDNHQEADPPQDRPRQTGLFGEVERAQAGLAVSQFDRALRHHEECVQNGDAREHRGGNGDEGVVERNHAHGSRQHQPGHRFEKTEWSERNVRKGMLLQLPAKRDRHAGAIAAEVEFSIAPIDKIERKS
jgi:hypothetical protein